MINTPEKEERELVVPLRLNTNVVVFVSWLALIGADGLFMVVDAFRASFRLHPSLFLPAVAAAVAAMVPAPFCIFYRCHARLVLSEAGLRWRTWGDWRRTTWDGVRDYYDVPPRSRRDDDHLMTINTEAGNLRLCRDWRGTDKVRQWVEARATAAEAAEWGVLGQRSCAADTRTFVYSQKDFWDAVLTFGIFLLSWTLPGWYMILHPVRRPFAGVWNPGNFWGGVATIIFEGALSLASVALVNFPLIIFFRKLPEMLETRQRRFEKITTRQSGVTFDNGKRQVSADWNEVTGNFLQPSAYFKLPFFHATSVSSYPLIMWRPIYVLETKNGPFEYSPLVEGNEQLGKIIAARALPLEVRDTSLLPVEGAGGRV